MRALAFAHLEPDPVSLCDLVSTERRIEVDRVRPDWGDPVRDWRSYELIVAMGAGAGVWQADEYLWIADQQRAMLDFLWGLRVLPRSPEGRHA